MASDTLQLIIRAKDAFSQVIGSAAKSIRQISEASQTYHKTLQSLNGTANAFRQNMTMLAGIVGAGGIAKSFVDINASAEKTKLMLKGLMGSTESAARAFQWILDISTEAPFSISAMKDAFIKLQVAGLDPMKGSLVTLMDTISAFGGSDQDIQMSAVAIQQMAGKGVISMEELRQQLSERIPTAAKAMAEGLGMSLPQLYDAIQKGSISATNGLNAMIGVFQKWYGGTGLQMMNSWTGLISNLKVAWEKFMLTLGESGMFEKIKSVIDGLLKKIEEMKTKGELKVWADRIAITLNSLINLFMSLARVIGRILDAIGPMLPAFVEMVVYFKTFKVVLGTIIGAPLHLAGELTALTKAFSGLSGILGIAAKGLSVIGAFFAGWQIGKAIGELNVFGLKIREWAEVVWTYVDQLFTNIKTMWIEIKKYALEAMTLGFADTSNYDKQIQALKKHKEIMESVREDIFKQKSAQNQVANATKKTTEEVNNLNIAVGNQDTAKDYIKAIQAIGDSLKSSEDRIGKFSDAIEKSKQKIQSIIADIDKDIADIEGKEADPFEMWRQGMEELEKASKERADALTPFGKGSLEQAEQYAQRAREIFKSLSQVEGGKEDAAKGLKMTKEELLVIEERRTQGSKQGLQTGTENIQTIIDQAQTLKYELTTLQLKVDSSELDTIIDKYRNMDPIDIKLKVTQETQEAHRFGGLVGGVIRHFASGGWLPGWGGGDKIKAVLEAGEYVIRKEAVAKYGTRFFDAVNSIKIEVPSFQDLKLASAAAGITNANRTENINNYRIDFADKTVQATPKVTNLLSELHKELRMTKLRKG